MVAVYNFFLEVTFLVSTLQKLLYLIFRAVSFETIFALSEMIYLGPFLKSRSGCSDMGE